MNKLIALSKNILNLIYPLKCVSCKKDLGPFGDMGVCRECLELVRKNPRPHCIICGRPETNAYLLCQDCRTRHNSFERAYSACLYEGALKEMIHAFKYNGRANLVKVLSNFMLGFIKEEPDMLNGIDYVTFVPMQKNAFRKRRFNQARLLAEAISGSIGIKFIDTLTKRRATRPQSTLSRDERLVNIKNAIAAKDLKGMIKDKRFLLVDDVMTTGATLNECALALKDAGAKDVTCFTLSRGK